jgi:hypothetical protein
MFAVGGPAAVGLRRYGLTQEHQRNKQSADRANECRENTKYNQACFFVFK